jgi:hypothetical protein
LWFGNNSLDDKKIKAWKQILVCNNFSSIYGQCVVVVLEQKPPGQFPYYAS